VPASDLADLQRVMADAVRRPAPGCPDAEARVTPSARGMTPAERLEVYREQYWLRHERNLADDYPTLAWAIGGAGAFAALAREYLAAFPPRTWDLQRLGADMPAFVGGRAPAGGGAGAHAMACDAARLDWAFMEVFDAPDAPPFDPRVLASTPEDAWPGARVLLHPSVRRLALRHPLLAVRDALKAGEAGVAPPAARATPAVVWRDPACFPRSVEIEAPALALLERLAGGEPLGPACEAVAREGAIAEGDLGERVGAWFQDWTARGWIARVET
jgi:hypothetical protein